MLPIQVTTDAAPAGPTPPAIETPIEFESGTWAHYTYVYKETSGDVYVYKPDWYSGSGDDQYLFGYNFATEKWIDVGDSHPGTLSRNGALITATYSGNDQLLFTFTDPYYTPPAAPPITFTYEFVLASKSATLCNIIEFDAVASDGTYLSYSNDDISIVDFPFKRSADETTMDHKLNDDDLDVWIGPSSPEIGTTVLTIMFTRMVSHFNIYIYGPASGTFGYFTYDIYLNNVLQSQTQSIQIYDNSPLRSKQTITLTVP